MQHVSEAPMRVLIVDDHPVTRDGLRSALSTSDEIEIVGEATNGPDAVKAAKELDPDIVFMDVRMPGMNGIEATKAIRENDPNAKVILFTVEESQASVGDAIRAGVAGYLLKDSSAGELIHAAKRAQEGGAVIAPALTRKFIEEAEFIHQPHEDVPLSPREKQILQRVANGATTKEVAHDLHISPHTVKTHLERIYEKLGANDRAEAVAIAMRRGLVD
ncbi:MAG: response regulator transcription factor [Actinobacteria bacterium]|jgi:DNA-binding NarL/FixJ family response regulator|nr:MAG: response regulator transcription factor [Actinomycetota bacterium]